MSVMDLGSVVDSFATGTYEVRRRTAAALVDGFAQPPTEEALSAVACVVVLSGREVQRLPEGMRTRELRNVYTRTRLRAGGGEVLPDVVLIDGFAWEVVKVDDWRQLGGYCAAVVARNDGEPVPAAPDADLGVEVESDGEVE